jgi:molybdopterin molybdotransferase
MSELFTVFTPDDALAALVAATGPILRAETVALHDARERVLDQTIVAAETLPAFPRALMDGFAVRAADTRGASESAPAYLRLAGEVLMGRRAEQQIAANEVLRIHTGAMLPPGADAVIMLEETNLHGDDVEVLASVSVGENVLLPGEDVQAGAVALEAGVRLDAAALGGLAALGHAHVAVRARPRIAVLSTGDEVVAVDAQPVAAQVRDVNTATIAATIADAGGEPVPGGIVRDDVVQLTAAARAALAGADALVISAGSSVSHRDLTADVIAALGAPGILVHGLAIRPGKPTILAVCNGKPVIGLPGNPASALVVAWRILRPLVRHLGGEQTWTGDARVVDATLALDVPSRPGREDYVPCRLARADRMLTAHPIFGESNLIFTLVRSDGLIRIPLDRSGLAAGERVEVVRR